MKIVLETSQITSDRELELNFSEATMNLTSTCVLCIFGNEEHKEDFLLVQLFKVKMFTVFHVSFNKFLRLLFL